MVLPRCCRLLLNTWGGCNVIFLESVTPSIAVIYLKYTSIKYEGIQFFNIIIVPIGKNIMLIF